MLHITVHASQSIQGTLVWLGTISCSVAPYHGNHIERAQIKLILLHSCTHLFPPPPEIVMHHNLALPLKLLLIIRFTPRCVKGLLSFGPHTYSHA